LAHLRDLLVSSAAGTAESMMQRSRTPAPGLPHRYLAAVRPAHRADGDLDDGRRPPAARSRRSGGAVRRSTPAWWHPSSGLRASTVFSVETREALAGDAASAAG